MAWSEIKHALNSTLGTSNFESLDDIIKKYAYLGSIEFKEPIQTGLKVPKGAKYAVITACGAGGGGGTSYSSEYDYYGGGGGGGAAISGAVYSVIENTNITITVGRGGELGTRGGSTVIGNIVTLLGGKTSNATESSNGKGGAAGGSGGGKGGAGGYGASNGSNGIYGKGGTAVKNYGGGGGSLGNGGTNSYGSTGTTVPPIRGGGGATGQSGANGYVYIEWRG